MMTCRSSSTRSRPKRKPIFPSQLLMRRANPLPWGVTSIMRTSRKLASVQERGERIIGDAAHYQQLGRLGRSAIPLRHR
jgi:hypothetical protein